MKQLFFLGLILSSLISKGQSDFVDEILEYYASTYSDESDLSLFANDLYDLAKHPMNLNDTNRMDLLQLRFLSTEEIENILLHIQKNGPLINHLELQVCQIPKFKIEWMQQLTVCKPRFELSGTQSKTSHVLVFTYQNRHPTSAGFKEKPSKYSGNSSRMIFRYRGSLGKHIKWNYTGEKDAGEAFKPKRAGFDLHSANVVYTGFGRCKKLIIGDYRMGFGQGLNIGSGLMNGKSSLTTNVYGMATGIKAYRSLDENLFMRGLATEWHFKNVNLDVWFNRKKVDANLAQDSLSNATYFTSRQTSGLHRTKNEIADKNSMQINEVGIHGKWTISGLTIGAMAYRNQTEFAKIERDKFGRVTVLPKSYQQLGIYVKKNVRNGILFSEVGSSFNQEIAMIFGGLWKLSKEFSIATVYRVLPSKFNSLHTSSFTESSRGNNEKGLYLGLQYKLKRGWSLSAYCDTYLFPDLSFNSSGPVNGNDYLLELRKRISRHDTYYIRLKNESKTIYGNTVENEDSRNWLETSSIRNHLSLQLSRRLKTNSRLEFNWQKIGNTLTFASMFYQDFGLDIPEKKLKIKLRFVVCSVPDYGNRFYTYENDVSYAYSVPALSASQTRTYALFQYRFSRQLDMWLKLALDYKSDGKDFGSGLDSVSSPYRSDIKVQIRWHI